MNGRSFKRRLILGIISIGLLSDASVSYSASGDLSTRAEKTEFKETGRFEEVERLARQFEKSFPRQVKRVVFGKTPEGRPMLALVASSDGILTPAAAHARKRPVVYFQGGIHAGEIDGKDAGFRVLRALLTDPARKSLLRKVTVVFVPVFNVDGHERFGPNNRPNQIGPIEMGWRTTAQNLNLNRDYVKADTPEMQAMLAFYGQWDPLVSLDLHVTDGAEFQHDVSVEIAPTLEGPEPLKKIGNALQSDMMTHLTEKGHLPVWFYPSFENGNDPYSGIAVNVAEPRFSQSYWSARNRIGILVETHSWKDYATRVRATEDVLWETLTEVASHGREWLKVAAGADQEALEMGGKKVDLAFEHTPQSKIFNFQGYAFKKTHSDVSGQDWIQYDRSKKEVWKIPLFDQLAPSLTITAPRGGYLIPPAYAALVTPKLRLHGIEFTTLKKSETAKPLEVFRAGKIEFAKESFEGHQRLKIAGDWSKETRDLPAGTIFIPIHQKLAFLVLQMLEPQAQDSFVAWGLFNSAFEKKEYMEDYVSESFAREMLKNPAIESEFKKALTEKEFAGSPERRLEFFHRHHPSWDERYALAPVFRTESLP